jgi:DNA-directed RNA polymerase subunit RPC12/RpoP
MKKVLVCFLSLFLFTYSPVLAGEKVAVECANQRCNFATTLSLGGARRSPAITCYCAQCRDFVRLRLQNWDQYRDQTYHCPTCGQAVRPVYAKEDIAASPCPKCGEKTLKAKILLRYD